MSDKKIVVPKGMLDAASLSTVKNNDFGQQAMNEIQRHYKEWPGLESVIQASLRWMVEDWEKSPNAKRMPEPWYTDSLKKWEKFASQWQKREDINFVDMLIFFGNILNERFVKSETEVDPLVMHIMRHFDDTTMDKLTLRNRAESTVSDYKEYVKRNR
jgi:hypothetical protein